MKKSIIDIANELNLAPSTISKIMNNTGRISAKTRERVLAYIQETGYVAISSARILSAKKSWTIGVIYSDISLTGLEHPFFSKILQSFKTYVEGQGYEIVFIVKRLGNQKISYLELIQSKKVDGVVIVMEDMNNAKVIDVINSSIPVVSTDIVMENLHSIISDDRRGVELAIDFAIQKGHQHIGVVCGPITSRSFSGRLEAFEHYMKSLNQSFLQEHIVVANGFNYEAGFEAGVILSAFKIKPDIVLVFSDVLAFGVINGLKSKGILVPDDISVIGYDDIDFSRLYTPRLTTIKQDTHEIGRRAAIELLKMINEDKEPNQHITLVDVELVERDSTK